MLEIDGIEFKGITSKSLSLWPKELGHRQRAEEILYTEEVLNSSTEFIEHTNTFKPYTREMTFHILDKNRKSEIFDWLKGYGILKTIKENRPTKNYILNSKVIDWNTNDGVNYPIIEEYTPNVSYKVKNKGTTIVNNLITNGDFSDGTISGWSPQYSTLAYDSARLRANGNGTNGSVSMYKTLTTGLIANHVYYVRFKATVDVGCIEVRVYNGVSTDVLALNPTGTNVLSGIITCKADYPHLTLYEYFKDSATQNGKYFIIDDVELIDLTATGATQDKAILDATPFIATSGTVPLNKKGLSLYSYITGNIVDLNIFNESETLLSAFVKSEIAASNVYFRVTLFFEDGTSIYYNSTPINITANAFSRLIVNIPKQTKKVIKVLATFYSTNTDMSKGWTDIINFQLEKEFLSDYEISTNETNGYFKASVISGLDADDDKGLEFFKVKFKINPPFLFLDSGLLVQSFTTSPCYLTNPSKINSYPTIKLYGFGDLAIVVNGVQFKIPGVIDYVEINTESKEVWKLTENLSYKTIGEYPVFKTGTNAISWNSNVTKVEITPNWREL